MVVQDANEHDRETVIPVKSGPCHPEQETNPDEMKRNPLHT
jgi:hypothetical protein